MCALSISSFLSLSGEGEGNGKDSRKKILFFIYFSAPVMTAAVILAKCIRKRRRRAKKKKNLFGIHGNTLGANDDGGKEKRKRKLKRFRV